jgi:S-formylglutathione hydrolase
MYDYIVDELPELIEANFPVTQQRAISGHSMGGHGALSIALTNPNRYSSASAFSPIVNPTHCPWGKKAFGAYLGNDRSTWAAYDSCELMSGAKAEDFMPMLIDQGCGDDFLAEQLLTSNMDTVVEQKSYPATIRMQEGYDHSYYFIASFIKGHLRFHAQHFQ